MAMTWGRDETGLVVLPAGGKAKKVKPPKPAKSAEPAKVAKTKPSVKLAIPEDDIPRYAPPIGLPIAAAAPAAWPTATAQRPAAVEPRGAAVRVLRFLGTTILVIGIAAGGFAAGALTELGTEAEHYVLGLTSSPASASPVSPATPADPALAPAPDPRIATLEAELAAARAELAARPPAAPAPAVSKDDVDEREKSRRRRERRERREREREEDRDRDRDSDRRRDRDD